MPRLPYPRLRASTPIITRSADQVQVGLGAGSVVLKVASDPGCRLLGSLTGDRPLPVLAAAAGLSTAAAQRLVAALDLAGLLDGTALRLAGRTVKIIGCGRLGSRLAELLVQAGLDVALLADDDPADPTVHADARPGSSNAEALAERLGAAAQEDDRPDRTARRIDVRVLAHWTKPDTGAPDLTVVATDTPECDRVITDTLLRDDQPHLLLRGQDDGVLVGPYVQPGHGSCVRCGDLHRRDRDPDWPILLHQLSRRPARSLDAPPAPVTEWGTATAAAQVLAWAGGRRPEVWGATLELSGRDWMTRLRTWPVHPCCGCDGLVAAG